MTDIIEVLKPDSITVTENLPDVLEVSSSEFGSVDVTDVTYIDVEAGTSTIVEIYNSGDGASLVNPNNPFQNDDQPPKPSGLVYSLFGINGLKISWNPAAYFNHKHTNIYSSPTNSFNTATLAGSSTSTVFDTTAPTGAPNFYWIEFVSLADITGVLSDVLTASVPGSAAELLAIMQEQVNESLLTQALVSRIDKIEVTESAVTQEIQDRTAALAAETLNRANAILLASATEAGIREQSIIDGIAAADGYSSSIVATEAITRADADSALSSRTTALESTVGDPTSGLAATATALNSLETRVTTNEGDIFTNASDVTSLNTGLTTTNTQLALANLGLFGDASITYAVTAPLSPVVGDIWVNTTEPADTASPYRWELTDPAVAGVYSWVSLTTSRLVTSVEAINALDARVVSTEDELTITATELTKLEASIRDIDKWYDTYICHSTLKPVVKDYNKTSDLPVSWDLDNNTGTPNDKAKYRLSAVNLTTVTPNYSVWNAEYIGTSWIVTLESEMGSTGDHPKFEVVSNKITVRTYGGTTNQSVFVTVTNTLVSGGALAKVIQETQARVSATEGNISSLASDSTLLNTSITIDSNGNLSGAGGGTVTLGGLGGTTAAAALTAAQNALNEAAPITLISSAGISIVGSKATVDSASSWNQQVYSKEGYTGGAFASARVDGTAPNIMFGLNTDPTANASYSSLDFVVYIDSADEVRVYESNVSKGLKSTHAAGDTYAVMYNGVTVKYLQNGQVIYTSLATITSGVKYFFDSSFSTAGKTLSAIMFGALTSADYADIGGTKPPSDADNTASATVFQNLEASVTAIDGDLTSVAKSVTVLETSSEKSNWIRNPYFDPADVGEDLFWPVAPAGVAYGVAGELSGNSVTFTANGSIQDLSAAAKYRAEVGDTVHVRARVKVSTSFNGTFGLAGTAKSAANGTLDYPSKNFITAGTGVTRDAWVWVEGTFIMTHASSYYIQPRITVRSDATLGTVIVSKVYYSNTPYDGNTAALAITADAVDGLSAKYAVKTAIDAGGKTYVAGFGLLSTVNTYDDTVDTEFAVATDKFTITAPSTDGTVGAFQFSVEGGVVTAPAARIVGDLSASRVVSAQSATFGTSGYQLGIDDLDLDTPKLYVGNGDTKGLFWNGDTLEVKGGDIVASHIFGTTIAGGTNPEDPSFSFDPDGHLRIGSNAEILSTGVAKFTNMTASGTITATAISGVVPSVAKTALAMNPDNLDYTFAYFQSIWTGSSYYYRTGTRLFNHGVSFNAGYTTTWYENNRVTSIDWHFPSDEILINYKADDYAIAKVTLFLGTSLSRVWAKVKVRNWGGLFPNTTRGSGGWEIRARYFPRDKAATAGTEARNAPLPGGSWTAWSQVSRSGFLTSSGNSTKSISIYLPLETLVDVNAYDYYKVQFSVSAIGQWDDEGGEMSWYANGGVQYSIG